ncbi:hypothetical protein CPAV1605_545 [seawater metagenome]|uniref:Uncharacterized protein n=1 Tax=seawater metagenome TaxID=1561972 RepID=A0A5E8CM44_9ZZZZ
MSEDDRYKDYICIMKATGTEVKLDNFASITSNSVLEYQKECEKKYINQGEKPLCRLIERSTWLDPSNNKSCYVVKKNDDGTYEKVKDQSGSNQKYYTTVECNQNPSTTTYENDEPTRSVINLAGYPNEDQISSTQDFIILFTLIFVILVYLFWNIKFDVKRPYYLYDYITKSVVFRIMLILAASGIIFYLFCPYNICFLPLFASKFRKQPMKEIHDKYCQYDEKSNPNSMGCVPNNTYCNLIPWFPGCTPKNELYTGWIKAYNYDNTTNDYLAS